MKSKLGIINSLKMDNEFFCDIAASCGQLCVCTYYGVSCVGCHVVCSGDFLVKETSWQKLVTTFGPTSDLKEIVLPEKVSVQSAQFLEAYFQKPVVFVPLRNPSVNYLQDFWNNVPGWKRDRVNYFFQRLQLAWAENFTFHFLMADHPNQVLAITILIERGLRFPDNYYNNCDTERVYGEIDELIVLSRPNIDRMDLVRSVLAAGGESIALVSRPFLLQLLPQLTDFTSIRNAEGLQFLLDHGNVPRIETTLWEFAVEGEHDPDFVRLLVENWQPETYEKTLRHVINPFRLEFLVQIIISGRGAYLNGSNTNGFQAAQRIAEVRLRNFGTKVKSASKNI